MIHLAVAHLHMLLVRGGVPHVRISQRRIGERGEDIIELRNDYSQSFGDHRITVGGQAQFFDIRNLFARDSYGIWQFASVADLRAELVAWESTTHQVARNTA